MESEDLKMMFDPCVNRVLELIDEQAAAVAKRGGGVKVIIIYVRLIMCLYF